MFSPLILISIVNWNTSERTLACLRSLRQLSYAPYRVVVVDNASQDDSVAKIRAEFPDITILVAPRNGGFADGHALALAYAQEHRADALWILNSDALVEADTLTHLVQAWGWYGDGLYGGVPIETQDSTTIVNFPPRYLKLGFKDKATYHEDMLPYDDDRAQLPPTRVSALAGSTMLIPLSVVAQHGWMSSAWFMYGEETDYCLRLGAKDVPMYWVWQSRIQHSNAGSSKDWREVRAVIAYYRTRNEIIFGRLYGGLGISWTIALKKLGRALINLRHSRLMSRMTLWGVWDGIRGKMGKRFAPEEYLR
jgi:GT2 family glycosyltransferase